MRSFFSCIQFFKDLLLWSNNYIIAKTSKVSDNSYTQKISFSLSSLKSVHSINLGP